MTEIPQAYQSAEGILKTFSESSKFFKVFSDYVAQLEAEADRDAIQENLDIGIAKADALLRKLRESQKLLDKSRTLEDEMSHLERALGIAIADRWVKVPLPTVESVPEEGEQSELAKGERFIAEWLEAYDKFTLTQDLKPLIELGLQIEEEEPLVIHLLNLLVDLNRLTPLQLQLVRDKLLTDYKLDSQLRHIWEDYAIADDVSEEGSEDVSDELLSADQAN